MSGAQFGDPKELRPVALGEAPFGIRLYDSRPDGRPPVSEKMLHQTMKGLDFSACQIGSDRRCATRTEHGEPVGPDHSLEFRRHKSRMASCADSPGVILRTRHTGSSTKGVRRSTGLLHRRPPGCLVPNLEIQRSSARWRWARLHLGSVSTTVARTEDHPCRRKC
ncbi:uncharacterized protein [Nerophis lumbriciformis]|uniref:uncharacterized protein isoform X5 n=1 Tax=Nerophis lumbriciformis TaxID=546530 RepID=UPI003BA9F40C